MPKTQAPSYSITPYGQKFRVTERTDEATTILRTLDTRDDAAAFLAALTTAPEKKKV